MATIEEGFCRDDTDCSKEQYCYDVSKRCVDYTQCSRYNRRENQRRSRQPSQCGPCLPSYTAETLGTGEMAVLCKKTNMQENVPEVPGRLNNNVVIYTVVGVSLICFLAVVLFTAILLKIRSRRASKRHADDSRQCVDVCVVKPSAPQAESSPFIGYEDRLSYVPFNNNKNLKDKNTLVRATGFMAPNWVRSNPNYEDNVDNDNMGALEQLHSRAELPPAADNSSIFPEQLALQVITGNVTEYEEEEMDNSANAVLVQRNNLSPSNMTEENNDDGDDDDDDNINANNNNSNNNSRSTSENNAQDSRERVRAPNILITQKISMNVNVLNGDC